MRVVLGLCWLGVLGCNPGEKDSDVTPNDTGDTDNVSFDFEPLREKVEEDLTTFGAPGAAVAISLNGEVIFSEGFGYKDPDNSEPMEHDTLLRIGSVTKMLTAAGVLRQVDLGQMALAEPLSTYIPDLEFQKSPGITNDIQLHHLLSHQAGLADYTPIDGGAEDEVLEEHALNVYAKYYFTMAPPGAMYNYSNPNFGLAGLALERAAGQPYRVEMDEQVFEPLGMDRTYFLADEVLADGNYATARTLNYWSGLVPQQVTVGPDSYDDAFSRPAGFAWSSVGDLLRFAEFAVNGDASVMAPETSAMMMTRQVDTLQFLDKDHYGYGWMIADGVYTPEGEWMPLVFGRHNGAIPGYAADLYVVPEFDFAMAILANGDGAYLSEAFWTALTIVAGDGLPETVDDPLEASEDIPIETFEGSYYDEHNVGDVIVTAENGELTVSMPLLDSMGYPYDPTLIPISPETFIKF